MKKIKIRFIQLIIFIKYLFYSFLSKIKYRKAINMFLISERGDEARDNGYTFYEYLKNNHPEVNVKYVIKKSSSDLYKIDEKDRVYYGSKMHYIYFINAKYLISSHIFGYSPDFHLFTKLDRIKKLNIKGKRVFLQHGITKDYIPMLTKEKSNIDLFICGAKKEYEYVLNNFGYKEDVVKYTGFSRYDKFNSDETNTILFMPTWRQNLFYCKNSNEFKNTTYYKKIKEILLDNKLNKCLEENNIKLIFYPHAEFQNYIDSFNINKKNIVLASKNSYDLANLINTSNMLITDYSSVFFDFAYQKKPIVYYQYDYEEYRKSHYSEGYFDYKKDSFGKILSEKDDIIDLVIKYINNNFKMDSKYEKKSEEFFTHNDKNNSKRIYEEIIKL